MHLIKNNLKIIKKIKKIDNYDFKNVNPTFSLKSRYLYALKCHKNAFFIVVIVKERIFRVGSETGPVTYY
jgi:hypothetical protein